MPENDPSSPGKSPGQKPVAVRYIVDDVDAAIEFYTKLLNFKTVMHPAPEFAILARDNLHLLLSKPSVRGGGGQGMPDGTAQTPGGWNRFEIEVDDLEASVSRLKNAGCKFRNEIVTGVGGKQILLQDPSGNPIELFQYFGS
jgi:catechol 2,3-dioxygenase-like lactoylglutathione lyase family enzyme